MVKFAMWTPPLLSNTQWNVWAWFLFFELYCIRIHTYIRVKTDRLFGKKMCNVNGMWLFFFLLPLEQSGDPVVSKRWNRNCTNLLGICWSFVQSIHERGTVVISWQVLLSCATCRLTNLWNKHAMEFWVSVLSTGCCDTFGK